MPDDQITIIEGDCLQLLPTLEPGSFDAALLDPPYGTRVDRDGYGRRQKWGGDQHIEGDADLSALAGALRELPRILARNAWVVLFASPKRRDDVGDVCREAGLRILGDLVWDKRAPGLGGGLRYQHESIILGSFGRPSGRGSLPSVMSEWVPKGQNGHRDQFHPHEKPVGVLSALACYATVPGARILDCFAGSGSAAVACLKTGRRCVAIEIDPDHVATIRRRVAAARTPLLDLRGPAAPAPTLFDDATA